MGYGYGRYGRPGYRGAQGAASATGTPPVNTALPSLSGSAVDGTVHTIAVGEWTGTVDHFDVAIYNAANDAVITARATVSADGTVSIAGAVGLSIYARVWAVHPLGAETAADSADFGPITAAGDTLILAVTFNTTNQDLSAEPITWVQSTGIMSDAANAYPLANANPGMSGLNYGWAGSTLNVTPNSNTRTDKRLKGALGNNNSNGQASYRIDIPTANGTTKFRIYMGMNRSSTTTNSNFVCRETSAAGTIIGSLASLSTTSSQICDAAGTLHANEAAWIAASLAGGGYIEVTPANGVTSLWFGKNSTTWQCNCLAVFKV